MKRIAVSFRADHPRDLFAALASGKAKILAIESLPQQPVPQHASSLAGPPASAPASGPGTELKSLLRLLKINATPTCPCNARAAQMDAWGPDECERRLDEIVGWLGEEAGKRGLLFSRFLAQKVVKLAIRRARAAAS